MAFTLLSFFALLFVAGSPSRWRWLVLVLASAQPLWMSRGMLPSVPRDSAFDLSQTERVLQAQIGAHRLMAGAGVFPGSTALLQRIPLAHGRAALEPAGFERLRAESLKPGASPMSAPVLDDVDTSSSAFRLLGASMLASARNTDWPGFEPVAGPEASSATRAEAFVHRAHDPLPRAFCVARIVEPRELSALDPSHEAFLDEHEGWRPASPATTARVDLGETASDRVNVEADGDALLVLTDAAYPGWIARVDGNEQPILTVDGLFRGVPITRGAHAIELEYAPQSLRIGAWIGALSLAAIVALASSGRRRRSDPAAHPAI
jgi:hypothetical protein